MICNFCGKDVIVEMEYEEDGFYLCPECRKMDEDAYNAWMDAEFGAICRVCGKASDEDVCPECRIAIQKVEDLEDFLDREARNV